MIPVEPFSKSAPRSREYNAVKKATEKKPPVRLLADRALEGGDHVRFYEVSNRYTVRVYRDLDGQHFIECGCAAGSPPIDSKTKLPTRDPVPCYHAAGVLLHIAENQDELPSASEINKIKRTAEKEAPQMPSRIGYK